MSRAHSENLVLLPEDKLIDDKNQRNQRKEKHEALFVREIRHVCDANWLCACKELSVPGAETHTKHTFLKFLDIHLFGYTYLGAHGSAPVTSPARFLHGSIVRCT
jgi:hypothetical protein